MQKYICLYMCVWCALSRSHRLVYIKVLSCFALTYIFTRSHSSGDWWLTQNKKKTKIAYTNNNTENAKSNLYIIYILLLPVCFSYIAYRAMIGRISTTITFQISSGSLQAHKVALRTSLKGILWEFARKRGRLITLIIHMRYILICTTYVWLFVRIMCCYTCQYC